MRAKVAKKLRAIARGLGLPAEGKLVPGGKLRRRPSYFKDGELHEGAPIPRPFVLNVCFRRAYREAKKIYKGLPLSILLPEAEKEKSHKARVADSMKQYHNVQN